MALLYTGEPVGDVEVDRALGAAGERDAEDVEDAAALSEKLLLCQRPTLAARAEPLREDEMLRAAALKPLGVFLMTIAAEGESPTPPVTTNVPSLIDKSI